MRREQLVTMICVAHADDEIFIAGGMIRELTLRGHIVYVVVLTDGGAGGPAVMREGECLQGLKHVGVDPAHVFQVKFEDTRLGEFHNLPGKLAEFSRTLNPTMVITHTFRDAHQDHVACARHCADVYRHVPLLLAGWSVSTRTDDGTADAKFQPTLFVEMSEHALGAKMAGLRQHGSQIAKERIRRACEATPERLKRWGEQANGSLCEAFEVIKGDCHGLWNVDDLAHALRRRTECPHHARAPTPGLIVRLSSPT